MLDIPANQSILERTFYARIGERSTFFRGTHQMNIKITLTPEATDWITAICKATGLSKDNVISIALADPELFKMLRKRGEAIRF
jgi:hypothetical protein